MSNSIYENRFQLIALLGLMLCCFLSAAGQNKRTTQQAEKVKKHKPVLQRFSIEDEVTALSTTAMNNGGVGLIIGVIDGDKRLIFSFGETTKGNGQKPTENNIFQIGSVSKTFTATVLAALVKRNLVAYSDPLQKYVPDGTIVPTKEGRKISLLDLATHTAGLPKNIGNMAYPTFQPEVFSSLAAVQLMSKPGTTWFYSNAGFGLLSLANAKADSNSMWWDAVNKEVAQPLGLADTAFQLTQTQLNRRVQGYGPSGNPAGYTMPGWPAMGGAGALYSTMHDMLRYLSFNMGLSQTPLNSLLPDLHKDWRPRTKPNQFNGLGWQIDEGTTRKIWKDGTTPGFFSYVVFCKEKKVGVVVLSNSLQLNSKTLGNQIYTFLTNAAAGSDSDSGDTDGTE
jgi:D-alanyl-D-alanine-carboxypeptidase/D-alanyl-D-alanine-endopeptidase